MFYDGQGNEINIDVERQEAPAEYSKFVKTIAHRGYSVDAPENTLPSYILAKKMGYYYVECDVAFTSDGVAVLLHDSTIDRTSNGTGNISNMTYEQVLQYDFGSWKSEEYTGTKIPTFREFITLCKELGLYAYIELKSDGNYTQENVNSVIYEVDRAGMRGNVSYASFPVEYLQWVKEADPYARIGVGASDITSGIIDRATSLKNGNNEIFISAYYLGLTDAKVKLCMEADIPLEVWTVDDPNWVTKQMNPYITGAATNELNIEKLLYEKHICDEQNQN